MKTLPMFPLKAISTKTIIINPNNHFSTNPKAMKSLDFLKTTLTIGLCAGSLFFLTSCDNTERRDDASDTSTTGSDTGTDTDAPADMDDATYEREKDELVTRLEQQKERIDARIDEMEDQKSNVEGQAQEALEQNIERLENQKDRIDNEITEVKAHAGDDWAQFKLNVQNTMDDAGRELDQTTDNN